MKKIYLFVLLLIAAFFWNAGEAYARVQTLTPNFTLVRDQIQTFTISYQSASNASNCRTSPKQDRSTGAILRTGNGTVLSTSFPVMIIPVINCSSIGTETLTIPIALIERTLRSGSNTIEFQRNWVDSTETSSTSVVRFVITGEAAAQFSIRRIELYFDNRRPETTVERHFPKLKAYADISFNGSGLLEGYWEVDGRLHSRVFQHLTFGRTVTLTTPEIPSLPTFDTGSHLIRFVITNPAQQVPLPTILYFVTPQEFRQPVNISTKDPDDGAGLPYAPVKFSWESFTQKPLYLIQFCEEPEPKCIFSAYTYDAFYTLPEIALKQIFEPGKKYTWQVKGFDSEQNLVGESRPGRFVFTGGAPTEQSK